METRRKVPVLMYHSVGVLMANWIWKLLAVPHQIFEDHLRVLKKKGFNTIDLIQLYNYVKEGESIPHNPIVLTFDDGYLDNWVYAYPLLKKYGFKGTIFVNPEFVDPTEEYRPSLEDVWAGKVGPKDLISDGFLSWAEMRRMEKDGVMDVQSHGMTHTWYFTGPKIIDFRHPNDSYVWMSWNKDPSRKYRYLNENQDDLMELGAPVYEYQKSLEARRYFPDESLDQAVSSYVKSRGGKEFFKLRNWREQLFERVEVYKSGNTIQDRYESEIEQVNRFKWEINGSKATLEKELGKNIEYFCWPGGGYNSLSLNLAEKVYNSTTLPSKDQGRRGNIPGEDPKRIKRLGIPDIISRNGGIKNMNGYYLFLCIREFQGDSKSRDVRRLLKLVNIFRYGKIDEIVRFVRNRPQ